MAKPPSKKAEFDDALAKAKEPETASHQFEWEGAVLATLAAHVNGDQSDLSWEILGRLSADDLTRSDHRAVFQAMKALHNAGDHVDRTTVKDWLATNRIHADPKDVDAIFDAAPTGEAGHARTYLDRLVERGRVRRGTSYVLDVLAELEAAGRESDPSRIDAAVAKVQAVAFDLNRTRSLVGEIRPESELIDAFMMDLELRQSDKGFVGLDVGFDHLNQIWNGMGRGLYVLAAPPSCGKTTFAKQLADQVAEKEGIPVLFFTFEQSAEELRIKTIGRLAGLNTRDVQKGRLDGKKVWDRGREADVPVQPKIDAAVARYKSFGKWIQIVEADRETTVDRIRVMAQAAKQKAKADRILVVIDYLQVVPVARPRDFATTKDKVDFLCSELARLARNLDSPVLAISSENRDAYRANAKPNLSAFKETGGIEYGADVAAAFWTDREETKSLLATDATDPHRRAVSLFVLKNRNGELAEVKMVFHADKARFIERERKATAYCDSLD